MCLDVVHIRQYNPFIPAITDPHNSSYYPTRRSTHRNKHPPPRTDGKTIESTFETPRNHNSERSFAQSHVHKTWRTYVWARVRDVIFALSSQGAMRYLRPPSLPYMSMLTHRPLCRVSCATSARIHSMCRLRRGSSRSSCCSCSHECIVVVLIVVVIIK